MSTTSLLDTHRRIREAGPFVSVVASRRRRDARTSVALWAADERPFVCPKTDLTSVEHAWRARGGKDRVVLFLAEPLFESWRVARAFAGAHPRVDVVVISPTEQVVEALLDTDGDPEFATLVMQGLVPVEDEDGAMIHRIAKDPRLRPFVRSPYEGLLYFILEARPETRGRFVTNRHLPGASGEVFEVDLLDKQRKLVVEVDGDQHASGAQASSDERKERDLRLFGYEFLRITHLDVARDPVGVWQRVLQTSEHLDRKRDLS